MKLYHGTGERAAKLAIERGILPRGKRKGNWKHTVLSRSDSVYLTDAYAMYFAINARTDRERAAVIEIDTKYLNPWLLAPDEDVMEQINRGKDALQPGLTMEQRTKHYRKQLHNYVGEGQWEASIKAMGTCCYLSSVPPEALTRIAYVDMQRASTLSMLSMDPSISLMNYFIVGRKYRGITKWIFGDPLGEDEPREQIKPEVLRETYPDIQEHMMNAMRYDYQLPPAIEREAIEVEIIR